jgi:glycerate kinase
MSDSASIAQPVAVLAAMDKFRGTATARELGAVITRVLNAQGFEVDEQPMSDGGEGFSESFTGEVVVVDVPGPLNEVVSAKIKIANLSSGTVGILEVADVVGRDRLVNPTSAEALAATSAGVGHLIVATARLGVDAVLLGCGGSATSDGGLGCYQVLKDAGGLPVPVTAATDVTATFLGARRYARQKGVDPHDLALVDQRLDATRALYLAEQGIDVERIERSGAAGGIPGAIAALGGTLTSGFDAVARSVDLLERVRHSALVITGEGRFDGGSLEGKVTVGVARLVGGGAKLLVVCGSVDREAARVFQDEFPDASIVSLEERFGVATDLSDVFACIEAVVADEVSQRLGSPAG